MLLDLEHKRYLDLFIESSHAWMWNLCDSSAGPIGWVYREDDGALPKTKQMKKGFSPKINSADLSVKVSMPNPSKLSLFF